MIDVQDRCNISVWTFGQILSAIELLGMGNLMSIRIRYFYYSDYLIIIYIEMLFLCEDFTRVERDLSGQSGRAYSL